MLLSHGRHIFPQKGPKAAIATWNLRRLGQGNWGESSWLKLRMLTKMARARGWRAILVSECGTDGKGTFSFRGFGGSWLFIFNGRCGVVLDPGMANMWRRGGERRHDAPDGRSLAVVIPRAGRGFRGRVLSLVSVYGPVSGAGFDDERRVMFDSLSAILGLLPERSVWIIGGDFNAEIGYRGVGEESTLGIHAHGRRTRSGRQMMEWAQGEELRFLLSFSRQACRDTWFHPKSFTGHAIDHLLCRSRDHRFLGASKVLFEDTVGGAWSAYTDHNPVEVKLAKGWVYRAPPRAPRRLRRPNWVLLRGSGDAATVARSALATELDRRVADEQPTTWPEVVSLGLGVARAVLGEEPKKDPRPWVRGCEKELVTFDQAVTQASRRKRAAESWDDWWDANREVRSSKRRRTAWLRDKEVAWWDAKAQQVQDKADQGDAFGVFATFKELRLRGSSVALGDVSPKEAQGERDAWAEHFRLIGEGTGSVEARVWENVPSYSPMDAVWGNAPAPNELHAALRQMSLGKAAGEDEVTAELLKFGGDNLWEVVVRVCREQWLLLIEAAPGAEVVWPEEWCVGLVVPLWKRKGNKKDKNTWRGITLLSVGSKLLARVVATRLRSWFDGHLGLHQFGFRRGKGVDDALQISRRLVEEVATSTDGGEGIELSFHDIEKAYPRVCRGALWDLLFKWGCDPSLLRVIQMLHGGTSYRVRVHGGTSKVFVLERGLREGCPSSPVLFNIYHAAVMMDFRARRKEAASTGQMDEGIVWVAQVDGGLFHPRSSRKRGRCQLRTVIGDVEFADDMVTCSAASFAPAVELLFDETLNDWSQRRNVGKTERLLVVPNAPRVQVGVAETGCVEARSRVKMVRHVGGLLSADGRHDHDTSYRVSRARRMVGMIARSWSRGQKDKRGRSSPLSLPLRLRLMKAHVDPILSTFCRSRSWTKAQLRSLKRAQAYALRRAFGVDRFSMQEEHISDKMLFQAADWEPIDSIIQRACWTWLGHVARMPIPAIPKLALWGWPSTSKAGSKRRMQGSWLKAVLAKTSLSARDWFRIAVSRGGSMAGSW